MKDAEIEVGPSTSGPKSDEISKAARAALPLLRPLSVGVCYLDTDLRYQVVNDWLAQLNGVSVEDHLGRTIAEVVPHVAEHVTPVFQRVLETGEPVIDGLVEAETPAQPGFQRVFQHSYYPIRSEAGPVVGVSCLVKEITRRIEAEAALREANADLENLLRELHHRTKNNLQVIISMLSLELRRSKNEELRGVLRDTANRVHTMALAHQRTFQSEDLSRISLRGYLDALVRFIVRGYEAAARVAVVVDMADFCTAIDVALPCGLIVNELMSNAVKHGFPADRDGTVRLSGHKDDAGNVVLTLSDDGVGLPDGFDAASQPSLGMRTIRAIAEHQLHGSIDLDSSAEGLSCTLKFSDPESAASSDGLS